jgi:hypothetical protein
MVAARTPNKTPAPAAAKSAGRPKSAPSKARTNASVTSKVVEAATPTVTDTVDAPQTAAGVEPGIEPAALAEAEPVAVEPAATPEPAPVAAAAPEPDVSPEAVEPEDAGIAIDEGVEQLASMAEQVIYEAEAIAGDAAHNFQVALKAATGAHGVVPTLSGVNTYLHRSVRINAQFVEQFAAVRSPIDLVNLQVRFLEEHRLAMLEFTQNWAAQKPAA